MIAIRTGRLEVPAGTGQRTVSDTHHFDRQVEGSWVALRGYWLRYADEDHHVRTIGVELEAGLQDTGSGPSVVVEGTLLLDDKNGDDPFLGWADYILFVELGRRVVEGGEAPEPEPVTEQGPNQKG
jgi:hypothetical protein